MDLDRADENSCSAIVLGVTKTKKGDRWAVSVQVIGGGPETCYPTLDEASALNISVGQVLHDCRVRYVSAGDRMDSRTTPDGKVFTERIPLYTMKFDLPRFASPSAKPEKPRP